jgi:ligand-binding sensor domain-containing protein/serine phosphatase RsbU (regulator of sigma subunit)
MRTKALVEAAAAAIVAITIVTVGAAAGWAQPAPVPDGPKRHQAGVIPPKPSVLRPRLRFQRLDRQSGLPSNTVSSIVQDRAGFMWLGTGDGLARYDGQRFVTFRHDPTNPNSISSSSVSRVFIAKDGTMWIGTEGGGVNRHLPQQGRFERFVATAEPGTLKSGNITAITEGPDRTLWIGTGGGGLAALDPATGKIRTYSVEDGLHQVVSMVLVGDDGIVWAGTFEGLYRFDPKQRLFEPMLQDQEVVKRATVTALLRDRAGDLWVGTQSGLARMSGKTGKTEVFRAEAGSLDRLADNAIKAIYEDRAGRLWVGTEDALHVFDPATGRFTRHTPDESDPMGLAGSTLDIFEDAAGVLWVGTIGGGAAMLDPRSLQFNYYKSLGAPSVYVAGKDMWVGTSEGLCRWRGTLSLEGVCYETGNTTAILVDRSGTVWAGTMAEGLFRLDPGSTDQWKLYGPNVNDPRSIADGPIPRLFEDRTGSIWIASIGGGLQRFDRQREEFTKLDLTDTVFMIKPDPKQPDVLWLGTGLLGLVHLDLPTGGVRQFVPNPDDLESRTDNAVLDFVFEGDGVVWLATYGGGLKRLDLASGKFKSYRRADGLPSDTVYSIQQDKAGLLWVSTLAGLVRFDPKTARMQVFTQADGLQSVEFAQSCSAVTGDGRFFFGGVKGFNLFRPEEIRIDQRRPPLEITSIRVVDEPYLGGRPLGPTPRLELDYDDPFAQVEFAALSYSGSDQFAFEYMLEGLNNRWITSDTASVSLTGLDTGDYTLRVRARDRHGIESEPIGLAIAVAPPPWRTWWAYSLYGVMLIGVFFTVYRYQQARIDRLEKLARLAAVEREFDLTAAVQTWFLPEAGQHDTGLCDLVGFYRAADKCSGDWWWYEDIGDGKLWVIVADVTGHGAGPAMVTAAVAMGLWVQANPPQSETEVLDRLARVNQEVLIRCKGKATMSITAMVLDQHTGDLVIYGLGGLPAVLMASDGSHSVIGASGNPLGSVQNLQVGERVGRMAPGDRLLITTDGILETRVRGGRSFGFRRFITLMRDVRTTPLQEAVDRIIHEVDLARADQPQEDDFTFCVLERRA